MNVHGFAVLLVECEFDANFGFCPDFLFYVYDKYIKMVMVEMSGYIPDEVAL